MIKRFGRGFSRQNLQQMRQFYRVYPPDKICQTVSGKFEESEGDTKKPDSKRKTADIICGI
ncbi:MAG: DUF1016 family protein [Candidatus Brocadia sp. AMX2]|nr:MAG: DUF1016 family protein [Candidatus Brocadia sp. AMX2]MBC6931014.1 DUF1016 family protein [Candidatus Brocadia sp.]MBL1168209.1 DUF1016 family protein [Candidatus Brocadia sp. AMX1]NOG40982.1 DUF1016 family protein [Planctomycetota bacterium]NUO06410.1 DUF1016 family protein [Candidatus Brocadia sinica]